MSDDISLMHGDVLRVERRFMVDGVVSVHLAEGHFAGVERVGTTELLVLRNEAGEVKLIPLASVSEITLVQTVEREPAPQQASATVPAWDPGVA